jgi:hypothetical protein
MSKLIVGRVSWDKDGNYWTPWTEFTNITEWRTWARDMNKALGFRAKREYIFINRLWSPAALIAEAQKKPKEMLKEG